MLLTGPVYIPERVRSAMGKQVMPRRGWELYELIEETVVRIKKLLNTKNDTFILASSGTGALEAAIANTLSQNDKVLALSCGEFGDRFAEIGLKHNLRVIKLSTLKGEGIDIESVNSIINQHIKDPFKALLITHNETSTGVVNDLKTLGKLALDNGILTLVDAVSSLGGIDIKSDEWGLDVVVSVSHKALMSAPGLSFISISSNAWDSINKSNNATYYWDLKKMKNSIETMGITPYTPAITLIYGLNESLKMIEEEGFNNVINRHTLVMEALRKGLCAIDLELLADNKWASSTVTAVKCPQGINPAIFIDLLKEKYKVLVSEGVGSLVESTFRIGHMGFVDRPEIIVGLSGIELALKELGYSLTLGSALVEAQKIFSKEQPTT